MAAYPGAAAAFSPSDVAGFKWWLKADAGTFQTVGGSAATANNDKVGEWQDQSGNGLHATQAASTLRGTLITNSQNGLPVVRADGVDDLLVTASVVSALTDNFTVFFAHRCSDLSAGLGWIFQNGSGNGWGYAIEANLREVRLITGSTMIGGTYTPGTFQIHTLKRASGTMTLRVNGASDSLTNSTAAPATPTTSTALFARHTTSYAPADLGEILIYEAAVSDGNRGLIETYLNTRWAAF